MKKLIQAALVTLLLSAPIGAQAREMLCRYDHITHVVVFRISEISNSSNLDVTMHSEISPVGGQEYYFWGDSPTADHNFPDLRHISGKLYWEEGSFVTAVVLVDFEKAIVRELQFPEHALDKATEEEIEAPLAIWDCRRTD